jgi:hypothetical protein
LGVAFLNIFGQTASRSSLKGLFDSFQAPFTRLSVRTIRDDFLGPASSGRDPQKVLLSQQGDQIGRIFACWAIANFVRFSKSTFSSSPMFLATIFDGNKICINLNKKFVGLHFGRVFPKTQLVTLLVCCRELGQEIKLV